MELSELRKKTKEELHKLLKVQREALRDIRFQVDSKQYKNVRELRKTKRGIARILTVVKEKQVLERITKK